MEEGLRMRAKCVRLHELHSIPVVRRPRCIQYQLMPAWRRFDGDGMLHAVRISDGRASYSNSYVQTTRLTKERAAGRALFSKVCGDA